MICLAVKSTWSTLLEDHTACRRLLNPVGYSGILLSGNPPLASPYLHEHQLDVFLLVKICHY
jgi:hypothetical protein